MPGPTPAGCCRTAGSPARWPSSRRTASPPRTPWARRSWRAREWLGLNATLDEGAPADFVVYDADPRQDVTVLATPARVVLRGAVVG